MNADSLLHWMSHLKEGSWRRFRDAAAELTTSDSDQAETARVLRTCFSDLGYADFFVGESQHWRVCSPLLAGLCEEGQAVLYGARSPSLVEAVQATAQKRGFRFEIQIFQNLPSRILLKGTQEQFAAVAQDTKLIYKPNFSAGLCHSLMPAMQSVAKTSNNPPIRWTVRSFDLKRRRWVEGELPATAREYTSKFGERRFYICGHQGELYAAPKRTAIYAAAAVRKVSLADYDLSSRTLRTAAAAPLPETYARTACLCSGLPPRFKENFWIYEGVAPGIAAALLVLSGQPHPGVPIV
jgi:murein DD-endopeptidase MepM/ murein hydrolase activator NlpD